MAVLVHNRRRDYAMALKDMMTGYGGFAFPLPKIAGQYKGRGLVVCGDARGVWDDLEAFGCRCDEGRGKVFRDGWDFLTVNKLVETFPGRIEHAYSNQPSLLRKFIDARRQEYEFGVPENTHSCNEGAKWRWPWGGHGTSGLGATLVGIGLGYDKVVLCGLPLDDGPHNGEPPWRRTAFATSEACGPEGSGYSGMDYHWKQAQKLAFDGKVKSMSGRTRDWFGAP